MSWPLKCKLIAQAHNSYLVSITKMRYKDNVPLSYFEVGPES